MVQPDEYTVEGYGTINPEYDQPYLAGAGYDPGLAFAKGGDPKEQAKHQKAIAKDLDGDFTVIPSHTPVNPTHPRTLKAEEYGSLLQLNGESIRGDDHVTEEEAKKENSPTQAAKTVPQPAEQKKRAVKKTASSFQKEHGSTPAIDKSKTPIKKVTSASTTRK